MYRNYVIVTLRNLTRNKLHSFVNVAGLMVALTCAIFIILFIAYELSFDSFTPRMGQVYRVDFAYKPPGLDFERTAFSMFPLGPAMKSEIPQVVAYTHIETGSALIRAGGRLFTQPIDIVDPDFFSVIPLPLVLGNPTTAFALPNSIVLTQVSARKLFGAAPAIGKTVLVDGVHPMTVTGVLKTIPHNSQLRISALIPNTSAADPTSKKEKQDWANFDPYLYVKLTRGSNPDQVRSQVQRLVAAHTKKPLTADAATLADVQAHLTPYREVHLSRYTGGMTPSGSWSELFGFGIVGAFMLLIASSNFTNLATARALTRAHEVALRKVLGARRVQLIFQFLSESICIAFLSLFLALALVQLSMPMFDSITHRPITFSILSDWALTLAVICVSLLTGVLGGIYPAFILSSFSPARILRGTFGSKAGSNLLRTSLIAMQFGISITLIIVAMVVFAQIQYSRRVSLGFAYSRQVVVSNASEMSKARREEFARKLATNPTIEGTALSHATPFDGVYDLEGATWPGSPGRVTFQLWEVGFNYFDVYHVRLLAGRMLSASRAFDTFSRARKGDTPSNVVITERAAKIMGYKPRQAINKIFYLGGSPSRIVGVVEDQRLNGPQYAVQPIAFLHNNQMDELTIRVRSGDTKEAIDAIDTTWHHFAPSAEIQRHFLSTSFASTFSDDIRRERILLGFVIVAISISCLGLYGLAAVAAQSRAKEIGIRKTFGARTIDILALLLWQLSIPVILGNAIAWPVAWYYLDGWLQQYASRIWLSPLYFLAAGAGAWLVACAAVASRIITVARTRTVTTLRYE